MTSNHELIHRFVEDAGTLTQSLGVGRLLGQIYAYLYFSRTPRTLDDMKEFLQISKGGASMAVRQLEQWHAVERVWVKGDRKDYYQASDWFGRIIKNAMLDTIGKKLESHAALLREAETSVKSTRTQDEEQAEEMAFIQDRLAHLRAFHQRAESFWTNPLVQMLLR